MAAQKKQVLVSKEKEPILQSDEVIDKNGGIEESAINSEKDEDLSTDEVVQIRILTSTQIKGKNVEPNQVIETDIKTAKNLVASGVADDNEDAVLFVLEDQGADVISI